MFGLTLTASAVWAD